MLSETVESGLQVIYPRTDESVLAMELQSFSSQDVIEATYEVERQILPGVELTFLLWVRG